MGTPAPPHVRTCPSCGGEPGKQSPSGRCYPCAARRREAIHRLKKLRPVLDRISGALHAVRRITDVSGIHEDTSWRGTSYKPDFDALLYTLQQVEREIEIAADEWTILLWTK